MYKVVIIDDEPIIVRGLEKTVKWEKWGCVVAGTAYNGIEGKEMTTALNGNDTERKAGYADFRYMYAPDGRVKHDCGFKVRVSPYGNHYSYGVP